MSEQESNSDGEAESGALSGIRKAKGLIPGFGTAAALTARRRPERDVNPDQASIWMDRMADLMKDHDLTAAQAVDYTAVEVMEYPMSEWARKRGVQRQTVFNNIRRGMHKLTEK